MVSQDELLRRPENKFPDQIFLCRKLQEIRQLAHLMCVSIPSISVAITLGCVTISIVNWTPKEYLRRQGYFYGHTLSHVLRTKQGLAT